ncbi:hypothetical protein AB0I28_16500 [Phytomonospora sp. NPDC050363]|uniref:hypothetical protein n=1 Tax=Phytomonospora sp. NPDC050363 TaxID=3155642 RepID=UPI00340AC06E
MPLEHSDVALWWSYFANGATGRTLLFEGPVAPAFEDTLTLHADWVLGTDMTSAHPDLSRVSAGPGDVDGRAALRFRAEHPDTHGFVVDGTETGDLWVPAGPAGEHTFDVHVRTRYGVVPGRNRVRIVRSALGIA